MKTIITAWLVTGILLLPFAFISLGLVPWGDFQIGPVRGYSWNGGMNIGTNGVTVGYHSSLFLFKKLELSPTNYPRVRLFYVGPFLITVSDDRQGEGVWL